MTAILARKLGMTQVFAEDGHVERVTVLEAGPCPVTAIRTLDRDGYEAALASSARPGHSEHQLGTAIDLRSYSGPPAWELEDWAATPEGAWVAANAHIYGFVMSYPKGMSDVTCYVYEPWHYRYVGRETAAAIHRSGLTPREYLWLALQAELERRAETGGGER